MPETISSAKRKTSQELFKKATQLMPGGVNSPVRAFKSIGCEPVFIARAKGSKIYDVDGNEYIDYVGSWGPMILGHADPDIENAIQTTLKNGASFGAPTALENEMAAEVIKLVPSIEVVRMVNSGTEAVMSALRLARAFTGKRIIVKFAGCYHGHVDSMLVQAGSGATTLGQADSKGVTAAAAGDTVLIEFNDKNALEKVFAEHSQDIAAVITEPVIGNSGCILPEQGYLEFLRKITKENGALLIFDEVMTGFRVALGGAQERFNIEPDITTLGKIIGGGLPVGAYGASREIMQMVAPDGPMYQAGTLSGNPLAMSAGLTCLRKIQADGFYEDLEKKSQYLVNGLKEGCQKSDLPEIKNAQFSVCGAMFGMGFSSEPIKDYATAKKMNTALFAEYYQKMLDQGVYLAPSAFEAGFLGAAHSYQDLDKTIDAHIQVITNL